MSSNPQSTVREQRIFALALSLASAMRAHPDRDEAIDAYDMARVLFRKTKILCAQDQSEDHAVFARSS